MRWLALFGLLTLACTDDKPSTTEPPPPTDTEPPTIIGMSPTHGSTNVPASIEMVVTFSEPMAASSIGSSLSLTGPQGIVASQVTPADNRAFLVPNAALEDGETYTATVTTAATDVAGNALGADVSSSFTIGVTGVAGRVLDLAGTGIVDVNVSGGGLNVTTIADGSFDIMLPAGAGQVLVFEKAGLVTTSKQMAVYPGVSSYLRVTMMAEATPITLDADTGGTIVGERGAEITAPTSAFVDGSGTVVTGDVQVRLTPYDPSIEEEAAAYPGDLIGSTLGGENVTLITQGVLDIVVRSSGGEDLQIAPGKTLDIRIPAPAAGDKPDTTQLWYFDEAVASWVEVDHVATYEAGSDSYTATIDHLTSYNADHAIDPSCTNGMVAYDDGRPAVGVEVTAQQGYVVDPHWNRGVYSRTTTDYRGGFCVTVEREEMVLIKVFDHDGTITERLFRANTSRSDDYPEDCAEPSCKSLRAITIGTVDPGENPDADCSFEATTNPFNMVCMPMAIFYECYAPEGACTFETTFDMLGGTASTMTFENGATIETTVDPITGEANSEVYGPDPFNTYCGKIEQAGGDTVITTASGHEIRIRSTESGTMEIDCYGYAVALTAEEQSALLGCNPDSGAGGGVACEAAPGAFDSPCVLDTDCNEGLECCGPLGDPQKCYSSQLCAAYDMSCGSDIDCIERVGTVCCSAGYFDMCLPPEACQ